MLGVAVTYADPEVEATVHLKLPGGATVANAVTASELLGRFALDPRAIAYAIHGQRVDGDMPLADGDRVELTRPLVADAKQARRVRAARRPPGKSGTRAK